MLSKFMWACRLFLITYFVIIYYFADTFFFVFLNLTLAYIPFEIAVFLTAKKRAAWLFWPLAVIWLVFYPNAPYILTDIFHLQRLGAYTAEGNLSPDMYIWKNFTFLVIGIFYGLFVGFTSLSLMIKEFMRRLEWQRVFQYQIVLILLTLLSSYGIYVGRFLRLHTIHLLTRPLESFLDLIFVVSPNFIAFVICLSVLQYILFYSFSTFTPLLQKIHEPKNQKQR
ncbi:Predicted membrane protein [Listeria grayi]|nr:Predicted membrane protein [Listeria grayi]